MLPKEDISQENESPLVHFAFRSERPAITEQKDFTPVTQKKAKTVLKTHTESEAMSRSTGAGGKDGSRESQSIIDYSVSGLEQPAEIVIDPWGISHIRANTTHDVFFAQGFAAARDRLWQLDMWRKRGLGIMAADFGPGFLAQDRASRMFLYRGEMKLEWAAYGTEGAESITEAFVKGINAWLGLTEEKPELLPPEFKAVGNRPEKWQAADVVRIRSHGLIRNVLSEAARAQVISRADLETDSVRRSIEPLWNVSIPEGLNVQDIPEDVTDVFKLATARIDLSAERMAASLEDAWRWTKVDELGDVYAQGSNNWAVSGERTATGRPILASDPHRAHSLPSLRQIVHLRGPEIDVIGAGEPALPGISIGHNGYAAFSLTISPLDQEDLYVYETNPDNPNLYRYRDRWESMRVECEKVDVKSEPTQVIEMKFTRHGPVIHEDPARHRAFAIRSVWFEPGASPYFASLAYMKASSPEDYAQALRHWSTPAVNHVYADRSGNIAWFVAGLAPIRPNWDGLLPVPGDGKYEWGGFHRLEDLPRVVNPQRGFFATANEMNLPEDYPYRERKLGFEWASRFRSERIHEVLRGQTRHTLEQSMSLQNDDLSIPARRLGRLIAGLSGIGDLAIGLKLLRDWDHHLGRESAAAALQEVWWTHHLKQRLLDMIAPDPVLRKLLVPGDVETLLGLLENPDHRIPDRDAVLIQTLEEAVADCRKRLGSDLSAWSWGRLHHGFFEHPLAEVAPGMRNVGPLPKGGSGQTPMAAQYRVSDFRVISGASFRMVVDVGEWDNSRVINAPGQSGNPGSPHYDDLAEPWARGDYVPLLYTKAAVDKAAKLKIHLEPKCITAQHQ